MRRNASRLLVLAAVSLAAMGPSGCTADKPLNPSFPLLTTDARRELLEMRANTASPSRPVLIIGGMFDPGVFAGGIARRIRSTLSPGSPVATVDLFATGSMDEARDRIIHAVEQAWPSEDPRWTTEVDVIGFSLGGVAARHAAAHAAEGARRLRVGRLFTIASPHSGARLAALPSADSRVWALRNGSDFLAELADAGLGAPYEVFAYVRLGDVVVGPENAGVNGEPPLWVAGPPLEPAHLAAYADPRILADIARRLRGETAYSSRPPAPIPDRPYSSENSPEPVLTVP
jgi:hypothetical protein